jgi:flagellar protein FliS
MTPTQAATAYRSTGMTTSSGLGLVVQAYELTLDHLHCAARALEEGDAREKGVRLSRALNAIGELRSVLDHEQGGEVAANLDRLYGYFIAQLTEANINRDPAPVHEVARHWAQLLESWKALHERSRA